MDIHFSQFLANYQHPLKNEHPKRHLSKIHLTIKTYKEIFKDLQVFLGCSIQENLEKSGLKTKTGDHHAIF